LVILIILPFATWVVVRAKPARWKLLNALIILAFAACGIGLAYALGYWGADRALGGRLATPLFATVGMLGALLCGFGNSHREQEVSLVYEIQIVKGKETAEPEPIEPDGPAK
jgi:hypothetical protein